MKAAVPIILAALVIVQAGVFIANSSGTYDETLYLHMAEDALQGRDNAEFSSKGVAPLPVLLAYGLPVLNNVTDYAQAILLARASAVALVAVPLVLVVFFSTASVCGWQPASIAAAIVALSPSIVAHGSIATTDACFVLFGLVELWLLVRYLEQPAWTRWIALVAAGGLTFAAKYSGVALIGVAAAACAWMDRPARPLWKRLASAAAIGTAMMAAGLAFTWNYHPIEGLHSQLTHQQIGHEGFLLGRRSGNGWWYYQIVALAVKSTYAELAALALAVVGFVTLGRTQTPVRVWGLAFAAVLGLAMTSHVSIGVRYVLLLVPLAVMTATAWVVRAPARAASAAVIGGVALCVQLASAYGASPRHLSYFNGLAGGPMNGYRLLADSNVDWGQDLPAMRQVLASVGAREPVAAYFGSAPPQAYGVNVSLWDVAGPPVKQRADWIVISATYLDGVYTGTDPFAGFRSIEPSARPTPSLFVYDASRPEVKAAIAQAIARQP